MAALRWFSSALAGLLLCLPSLAQAGDVKILEGFAIVEGTPTPPDEAVLVVELLDTSNQDEPAAVLSQMRFEIDNGFPAAFELSYDTALILPGRVYVLKAQVVNGREILYTARAGFPVLSFNFDQRPDVLMEPYEATVTINSPVGYKWRLTRLKGHKPFGFTKSRITFEESGSATGNTGCNPFRAPYSVDGDRLSFESLSVGKRGCTADILDRERSFVGLMSKVTRFERQEDVLHLMDKNGLELLRFDRE
ncbi:MAG: META domain-containing protein [Pseudomonadota bacterium]